MSSLYCIVVCLRDHTLISLSIVTDIVISLLITSSKWFELRPVWRTYQMHPMMSTYCFLLVRRWEFQSPDRILTCCYYSYLMMHLHSRSSGTKLTSHRGGIPSNEWLTITVYPCNPSFVGTIASEMPKALRANFCNGTLIWLDCHTSRPKNGPDCRVH